MTKSAVIIALSILLFSPLTRADDTAKLTEFLATLIPDHKPDSIKPSPLPGLYEIAYGPEVFYATPDGRYVFKGDLVDMTRQENLTETSRSLARLKEINAVPESSMIVYAPKVARHTVTVFYDVDCPYCRQMQADMPELNRRGIKVRYLAYPRTGIDSASYRKIVSVWCATDRHAALAQAESDQPLEQKDCDNPVKAQYELGNRIGIKVTPALVLENGALVNGYRNVEELVKLVEGKAAM